jgi:Na+-driven multidrug efflux pump
LSPYFILSAIPYAFSYPIRAMGQANVTMIAVTISQMFNIIFNYLLISGYGIFPKLGIQGAAIATNISKVIEFILFYLIVYKFKYGVKFHFKDLKVFRLDYFLSYLKIGILSAANQLFWALGITIYQILIGGMNLATMIAYGMIAPFEQLFINFFAGLGSAALILIGNALGRKDYEAAYSLSKKFNRLSILFASVLGCLLFFSAKHLLSIYTLFWGRSSELDNLALSYSTMFLKILGIFMFVRIHNMILSCGVLRSGGDALFIFVVETISLWCIGIPLVWFSIYCNLEPYYVYFMIYVEEIIKLIVLKIRFRSRRWMNSLECIKD